MLIIICGLPGSGKTTLAKSLCENLPAIHVSSDLIRRRLFPEPKYTEEEKERVYSAMIDEAQKAMREGMDVVADATFQRTAMRKRFIALASGMGADSFILKTVLPEDEVKKRLGRRRKGGPSDADFEVYLRIKADFEGPDEEHLAINSMLPEQEKVRMVRQYLGR